MYKLRILLKGSTHFLRLGLLPLSALYGTLMRVRNYLYDKGIRRSFRFDALVIAVGNLKVGGSGKTPHVEYLVNLLKNDYLLCTLSRGYKRKSHGFLMAGPDSTWQTIGDEPMQYYTKFAPAIGVAVGEDRALAIPCILMERGQTQIVLLDDAYQHRSVVPHLNLLLTEYEKPFYRDFPFPAGKLREPRDGARRADAIIVTKSPDILRSETKAIVIKKIYEYCSRQVPVFFSSIHYNNPLPVYPGSTFSFTSNIVLFSGTASANKLKEHVSKTYHLIQALDLPDHVAYTEAIIDEILKAYYRYPGSDKCLVTTEKDMVKLHDGLIRQKLITYPVFYLPIEVDFADDAGRFNDFILEAVKKSIN